MNTINILLFFISPILAPDPTNAGVLLKTAKGHPMQYYVSLPKGWDGKTKFPVVILFEAASKEYKKNIERFVLARGDRPFILVQPIHTNNGSQGRGDATLFPYTKETWDYIEKIGDCQFNADGINAIYNDVRNEYNTEERWYATGFEAGAHTLWWMVFNRPDLVKVAAAVAGNYRGRCIDENAKVNDARSPVIIKTFFGDQDEAAKPGAVLNSQWIQARDLAKKYGYNISEKIVVGTGHDPMEVEVMNYLSSFL